MFSVWSAESIVNVVTNCVLKKSSIIPITNLNTICSHSYRLTVPRKLIINACYLFFGTKLIFFLQGFHFVIKSKKVRQSCPWA
jgi:hypothetical protein